MTARRHPSPPAQAVRPAAPGLESRKIRRCLEKIIALTGDGGKNHEPAHSTDGSQASIRRLAEKALFLLDSLSFLPDEKKAPGKTAPFSISSVCFAAAGSAAAKEGLPTAPVRVEIDPSVPSLVEGDSLRLGQMLDELIRKGARTGEGTIFLSAVARRNLPEGIEILFSAGQGKNVPSFPMTFTDASPDEGNGTAQFLALLAEDNPLSARIMESNLETLGFRVVTASDGKEALALAEEHWFDIILMDIQMPVMDGVEATRALRRAEKEWGRRIPVLAVSASLEEEDRERCLEAGMDGFLPKSFSPEAMARAMASLLPGGEFLPPRKTAEESPLLSATGGNRAAAAEAAEIFLETVPPLMAEMKRAVAHGDRLLLASHAHRLKGNLAFFGAEKAGGLAKALEEAAKTRALEGLPSLLYSLISEVNRLLAEIRKEWGSRQVPPSEASGG